MSSMRGSSSGRWVVMGILIVVTVLTAVGIGSRRRARRHHMEQLRAGEATRARALNGLLGISHLRGLGRKYVYLPHRPGDRGLSLHYAEAYDRDGDRLIGVVGFDMNEGGDHAALLDGGVVFLIDEEGHFLHVVEGARLQVVGEGGDARILLWRPQQGAPDWVIVELADPDPRAALRFRGALLLDLGDSTVRIGQPSGRRGEAERPRDPLPTFRYDPEAGCFDGPDESPGGIFELDRTASPFFCSQSFEASNRSKGAPQTRRKRLLSKSSPQRRTA